MNSYGAPRERFFKELPSPELNSKGFTYHIHFPASLRSFPIRRASTPALLAVWGFMLGYCTAPCDISGCKKGFMNTFD